MRPDVVGHGVVASVGWLDGLDQLVVGVVAYDGLEWVLGWRQLGVRQIKVLARSEAAERQFELLRKSFGSHLADVSVVTEEEVVTVDLISALIDNKVAATDFCALVSSGEAEGICVSTAGPRKDPFFGEDAGKGWSKTNVRHAALGGLTRARGWMCSTGAAAGRGSVWGSVTTERSKWRFLEPSTPLGEWSAVSDTDASSIWAPKRKDERAPWPLPVDLRIEAYTVFFKKNIVRPLSDKEWAQLMDLRPEWGELLRSSVEAWRDNAPLPLRFVVEAGLWASRRSKQIQSFVCEVDSNVDCGRRLSPLVLENQELPSAELRHYRGWVWDPDDTGEVDVATTGDGAAVQYHLWNVGGNSAPADRARGVIRRALLRRCFEVRSHRARAFFRSMSLSDQLDNAPALRDCLTRLTNSSWFEWDDGSRLMFWEWPPWWRAEARDGMIPRIRSRPRRKLKWPAPPQPPEVRRMDAEKVAKLIRRRYLVPGHVMTTVPRFAVPKGSDDIRVVWDLKKSGVNEGVDVPRFFLLGFTSLVHRVWTGSYFGDFDVGEMFQNFVLRESEQEFAGVEVTAELRSVVSPLLLPKGVPYLRWERLLFGWSAAPYAAVTMMSRAIELAKGPPTDPHSEFQVSAVRLNMPGTVGYDPSRPRVMLVRSDGLPSSVVVVFVDDGRIFGANAELSRKAIRQITSRIQQLGIQDAGRKRELGGKQPRAWTGGVVHTDKGCTRKFVVRKKWEKLKKFLADVIAQDHSIDRVALESGLGFLVHLATVYEFMRPYLVGFYLAMHAHRPGRDRDGWPISAENRTMEESHIESMREGGDIEETGGGWDVSGGWSIGEEGGHGNRKEWHVSGGGSIGEEGGHGNGKGGKTGGENGSEEGGQTDRGPFLVRITHLMRRNAQTLTRLTQGDSPIQRLVRPPAGTHKVCYLGTDASGEGFGGRFEWVDRSGSVGGSHMFYGYWGEATDGLSSNWREMRTGLDALRSQARAGRLVDTEVWLVTDNEVFERAFYKGYSSSPGLYSMVEELWSLSITGNFVLHVAHVAGTRLIEVGIDGLSRGDIELDQVSRPLVANIPFGETPLSRSPGLRIWLQEWMGQDASVASPYDWIYRAQLGGKGGRCDESDTWVWDLPPGAGVYALEELALGRTKRLEILQGVILIPALLMPEWYRRFSKVADLYFRIPAGAMEAWGADAHEPLTVGIYLPSFNYEPWDWRKVPWMGKFGRALSAMFKGRDPRAGYYLFEFWQHASRISELPEDMVRPLLLHETWKAFFGFFSRRTGRRCPGGPQAPG